MKNNRIPKVPKAYSFKRIDSKRISERIFENSLMFLIEGIEQINTNPRQGIVSFWTGVELFIKAILVEEHWSLIVKNTRKINHADFESGNFVSIDFQQSINLVESTFNITLEHKTKNAFNILRKHRNKIVHFTNQEIGNKAGFELCDIFVELSNVWNELKGLSLPVIDFGENVIPRLYDNITDAINKHKVILEGKYRHVYETKLKHIKEADVLKCSLCNYEAVILKSVNKMLYEATCLVCSNSTNVLMVECEHCKNASILQRSESVCVNCHEQLDILSYIFGEAPQSEHSIATCHKCGSESVVCVESVWFCLNCFSYHFTPNTCNYCGSSVTCSTKDSHLYGCICCEGPNGIAGDRGTCHFSGRKKLRR